MLDYYDYEYDQTAYQLLFTLQFYPTRRLLALRQLSNSKRVLENVFS